MLLLLHDPMHEPGPWCLCAVCLSICGVCLSITFVYCVERAKDTPIEWEQETVSKILNVTTFNDPE